MPQKPGKYGIKFWILGDSKQPYILNAKPYLGQQYDENRGELQLGEHVVLKLMEPYYDSGYNVTTDSFFTSLRLSQKLLTKRTTLVGTLRNNWSEIPPALLQTQDRQVKSAMSLSNQECKVTLLSYKVKKNKVIHLLSTFHGCRDELAHLKPEIVQFYNETKGGVDTIDQMSRCYSTKAASRRWPLQVFFNLLDLGGINAFTLFRVATNQPEASRREFL